MEQKQPWNDVRSQLLHQKIHWRVPGNYSVTIIEAAAVRQAVQRSPGRPTSNDQQQTRQQSFYDVIPSVGKYGHSLAY